MTARAKLLGSVVLAATLVFALAGVQVADAVEVDSAFWDDDWSIHEPAINAIAAAGITKGCNPPDNDRFCPDRSVTRGEMAAFLVRAFELTGPNDSAFVDTTGHLFAADIAKLAANQITVGCGPPEAMTYCPDDPVSRGEMATFLIRILELTPLDTGPFVDTAFTVHRTSINAIAAADITKGCNPPDNDRFCPFQPVTRAEMATFLKRALDLPAVLNRLAIRESVSCNEELTVCSSTISIPAGRSFLVREGWYQALPATDAELDEFESATTDFRLTFDGNAVTTTLTTDSFSDRTERTWTSTAIKLTPGVHTLIGTWRWDGATNLTTTVTITSS